MGSIEWEGMRVEYLRNLGFVEPQERSAAGERVKQVRQEAWILCFLPEVSDGEDYGRAVTAALQGGVIAPVVDLTTPSSNEQKYRAPLKLTFCGVAMML